jgi:multidrug efflux system outer membrane protein
LPHAGNSADLALWWARLNDPVLADWQSRAQAQSPSLAEARSRVFQAREQLRGEQSASGWPN